MTQKKLSRRDAIKLLGATTGAAMLANLPSKWKTPELASGVLPAHAQTSGNLLTFIDGGFIREASNSKPQIAGSGTFQEVSAPLGGVATCAFIGTHWVQISEPIKDIPLVLEAIPTGYINWFFPLGGPNGVYPTDVNGKASIFLDVEYASLELKWSFQNASDGIDTRSFFLVCNPL
jgi:hypothetical protein